MQLLEGREANTGINDIKRSTGLGYTYVYIYQRDFSCPLKTSYVSFIPHTLIEIFVPITITYHSCCWEPKQHDFVSCLGSKRNA
jgi:hypothetical protein